MAEGKQTILIVEDEAPAAMALADALKNEGFEVWRAADGNEGLQMAIEKKPDILLADLKLPNMGGMEMIRELRKDAWGKNAKVIILTNLSDLHNLQEAVNQGAFHYLIKGDSSMADVVNAVRAQLHTTGAEVSMDLKRKSI